VTEKERPVFSDKDVKPTEEMVFTCIGEQKVLWKMLMKHLSDNHKDITWSWNYYNDGKSWLFKAVQKKKTIFWLAVFQSYFRITFYFGEKATSVIESGSLPKDLIEQYKNGPRYGKIRAISVQMKDESDLESVKKLIDLKKAVK
jgi:hypothetical protein